VAGAAAGVAELRGVVGLVGNLEIAAVVGHQAQAGMEGLRMPLHIGHRQAAVLHQREHRAT
jgi:hypothetical protein